MNTINPLFASSVDPSKISLTVESIAKMVIFLIGFYATTKAGFDPMTATTQVEAIRDLVISTIPAALATFHGIMGVYGVIRKLAVQK